MPILSITEQKNGLVFFISDENTKKLIDIKLDENQVLITIYNDENIHYTYNVSEFNTLLKCLNNKCAHDFYKDENHDEAATFHMNTFREMVTSIFDYNGFYRAQEVINESCIEALFSILESLDYKIDLEA